MSDSRPRCSRDAGSLPPDGEECSRHTAENLYVRAVKRLLYLSLVVWSLAFRKVLETVTGVRLKKIRIDSRMVETKGDWAPQALQQRVVRTEVHLRWRPWLRGARPLPPSNIPSCQWEEREDYDSLAPLPVIPRVRTVRRNGLTPRASAACRVAGRSLSFPPEGGRHELARQRVRAQQLTRQVADWRRLSRSVESSHPSVHPSLSVDRLTQELSLLQQREEEESLLLSIKRGWQSPESPESPGSTSEDEGLGSSPPLSPLKPISPPSTLERPRARSPPHSPSSPHSPPHTGLHSPPHTGLRSPPHAGLLSTSRHLRPPHQSSVLSPLRPLSSSGLVSPPRAGQRTVMSVRRRSPPSSSPLSPIVETRGTRSPPCLLGPLYSPGETKPTRRLKLRRVEGLRLGQNNK